MPWDFWLILFVLGVLIPWRGRLRLQHLLALPIVGTKEKLVLYGSTIAFQWVLMGLIAWRAFARGLTSADLGLARRVGWDLAVWSVAGTLLLGAFQWFNLRRVGRMSGAVPDFMRKLADRVLPHGPVEFVPYCALAFTAGVCEEFLYRGFVMGALTRAGLYPWVVVVISSVLFGLAHSYQGRSGVVGTTLLGLVFAIARLAFQSLLPVVVWHSAVDVAAGIAAPRYLLVDSAEL
ncbi:MAG: type II CAAX endopeptidase family protein [Candidatus Acidiferrum sp.]